jgi:hypothetical protein
MEPQTHRPLLAALRKERSKELVFALKTPDNLRPTE